MRACILVLIMGLAIPSGLRVTALSAQSATEREPVSRIARAIEVEAQAIELHAQPQRAADAARLHLQSAALRSASDPEAVESLAMAAHLFNYARRPLDARRAMEAAAQRALAMGDVVRAARAYVDATFIAEKQNNRSEMERLGRKALLLAGSPLLTAEERSNILGRIGGNRSSAGLTH